MGWQDAPEVDGGSWQSAPVVDTSIFAKGPLKIGRDAFGDTFRDELKAQPFGIQQIVGAGTALGGAVEGVKQFFGQGNEQNIEANKIMEQNAPVASFLGNASLTAVPFGIAGNSLKAAGVVGAGLGALNPVEGDQSFANVAKGKAINTALGGVTGVAGQAVANKAGQYISNRLQGIQEARTRNAPLDKTIQDAMSAGLVVPPSSVNPSFLNTLKEGVSGKIATAQVASNRNAPVIDSLARQAVGLPENAPLTSEAMQAIRKQAYQQGYAPIAQAGEVPVDQAYREALSKIVESRQGAARSFPGAADDEVTKSIFGQAVGGVPDKKVFVDGLGNLRSDIQVPSAPATRSLLNELKQSGGLNVSEVADIGQEGIHKTYPGLLRKDSGKTMDNVVEWMEQHGWLSAHDVAMAERDGVGGSHELARDMIRTALNKDPVIHPADGAAVYDYNAALKALDDMGIKQVVIPGTKPTMKGGINVDKFDAGDALKMSQILRDEGNKAFQGGDKELGGAKKAAAKAIEDQIERHLQGAGKDGAELLKQFRDARQLMAKAHTVEDAIVEGGGSINARKLAARAQAGKPLSGELETIGKFANNFPRATQPAMQIGGPGVSKLTHLAALGMGAGGAAAGGPVGAIAAAAAMEGLPYALRARMLSKAAQQAAAESRYAPRLDSKLARLLQNSQVGGTVLGLETLGQ
mgnify:CR=1 FL=1